MTVVGHPSFARPVRNATYWMMLLGYFAAFVATCFMGIINSCNSVSRSDLSRLNSRIRLALSESPPLLAAMNQQTTIMNRLTAQLRDKPSPDERAEVQRQSTAAHAEWVRLANEENALMIRCAELARQYDMANGGLIAQGRISVRCMWVLCGVILIGGAVGTIGHAQRRLVAGDHDSIDRPNR